MCVAWHRHHQPSPMWSSYHHHHHHPWATEPQPQHYICNIIYICHTGKFCRVLPANDKFGKNWKCWTWAARRRGRPLSSLLPCLFFILCINLFGVPTVTNSSRNRSLCAALITNSLIKNSISHWDLCCAFWIFGNLLLFIMSNAHHFCEYEWSRLLYGFFFVCPSGAYGFRDRRVYFGFDGLLGCVEFGRHELWGESSHTERERK